MGIAQFLLIGLMLWEIVTHSIKHGEKRESPYNKYNVGVKLFDIGVLAAILWWGGFWG